MEPFFCLSPEQTGALPPGDYTIRAILSIPGGAGWSGVVASGVVRVTVATEPPVMSPAVRLHKVQSRMGWMLLAGDTEGARREARRRSSVSARRLARFSAGLRFAI